MRHAVDHAQKLGFKNADEYLGGARSFVAEAIEKGYSATIRAADNTIRIFDQSTRRFASYELSDGKLVPKTFMKTDSVGYWTSQMRNYGGQVLYDLKELIK
jgi:pyocin large subunit-like protein